MPPEHTSLRLNLRSDIESDEEELTQLMRRLRRELSDLPDVERLESPKAPAPSRSKTPGIDWQALIITLAASGGVLTSLINTVQSWLTRHERTSVTLEIGGDKLVLTGVSPESERRLVSDWISRHATRGRV